MISNLHDTQDFFQDFNPDLFQRQQRDQAESLKYASYIQHAIFPSAEEIRKFLPAYFLVFEPRDIVSGDFYYITGQNEYIYLAVGDCTGHGVPGALMSILGITCLKEIIARGRFHRAATVLNQLREYIMKALNQRGTDAEQKDGIDMAMCILNMKNNQLDFAGAFNPVYIVRNKELFEIQGDKMPVGIGAEEEKPFTSHPFQLEENDLVYLFSDGFIDQFGGSEGKKFKYGPFRKLILDGCELSMEEQRMRLLQTFDDWKGELHQLDDMLVFGFRFHAVG
jgi:serine phosphatase RsbU (regulator of sigma subunit)